MKYLISLALVLSACGKQSITKTTCVHESSKYTLRFTLQKETLVSGDLFLSCYVGTKAAQSSGFNLVPASEAGTAKCSVEYDIGTYPDINYGTWTFDVASGTYTYADSKSARNAEHETFAAGECQ